MTLEYGMLMVLPGNTHSDGESTETKLTFVFNPAKLDVKASAKWDQPPQSGSKKGSVPQYKGAEPRTMDLDLVLDGWDPSGPTRSQQRDVQKDVATLMSWTRPTASTRTTKLPRPPYVVLQWGNPSKPWFSCYVVSVSASFTMFDETGKPVRATVKVSLKEVPAEPGKQNPTSGSLAGHQSHLMVEGDSLPLVAHRYYDRPAYWRGIAVANGIDDPQRVRPGTRLYLPPIEEVGLLST